MFFVSKWKNTWHYTPHVTSLIILKNKTNTAQKKKKQNQSKLNQSIIPFWLNSVLSSEGPLARISQQFVSLFECFHSLIHLNGLSAVPLRSPLSHRSERPSEKNPKKQTRRRSAGKHYRHFLWHWPDMGCCCFFVFFSILFLLFPNTYRPRTQSIHKRMVTGK